MDSPVCSHGACTARRRWVLLGLHRGFLPVALAVIVVLSLMQLPLPPAKPREKMLVAVKGGLSYVRNQPTLLALTG